MVHSYLHLRWKEMKEKDYQLLVHTFDEPVCLVDEEMRVIEANSKFLSFFETSMNELAGKSLFASLLGKRGKIKDDEFRILIKNLRKGKVIKYMRKGQERKILLFPLTPRASVNKFGYIMLLTEPRKEDTETGFGLHDYVEIISHVYGYIYLLSKDGQILKEVLPPPDVDDKYRIAGKRPQEFLDKKEAAMILEKIKTTVEKRVTTHYEIEWRSTEGKNFYKVKFVPFRKDNVLAYVHDITEQKKVEREKDEFRKMYYQAQKLESIGRLTAYIAHDFNNILQVVRSNAELLKELKPPVDWNEARVCIEEILKSVDSASTMIKALLTFSGKHPHSPEVVNLNKEIKNLLPMLRKVTGERIKVRFSSHKNLWKVLIDPSHLENILMNLVVNAIDAMGEEGEIKICLKNVNIEDIGVKDITLFHPGDYVLLTVADTGIGMDEDTITHIFEPFFTTKGKGKGTGLGLSTVYGLVKQNKGYIKVFSEKGKGTTFEIYFPRYSGKVDKKIVVKKRYSLFKPDEINILLVEDEEMALKAIASLLEKKGFKVFSANSPLLAVEIAEKHRIDLLITDVVMPEMNGVQLSRKLKEKNPSLKVIFMSGYPADIVEKDGKLKSIENYLRKPFTFDQLLSKIESILKEKQS
ncbi:hypothetical protein DRQ23_00905 [bacterium]|nr:MAG: hypothetical protein DRQ23_00905 [bacterium]